MEGFVGSDASVMNVSRCWMDHIRRAFKMKNIKGPCMFLIFHIFPLRFHLVSTPVSLMRAPSEAAGFLSSLDEV